MQHRTSILPLESGVHAKHCIEHRGKRRRVKELLRQRLQARRFWLRLAASGAAASTLATLVSLAQYA